MSAASPATQPRLTLVASSDAPRERPDSPPDPLAFLRAITASLDLDRVLTVLNDCIHAQVAHGGWEFHPAPDRDPGIAADEREPVLAGGRADRHRLEYALSFEGADMGTLVLMRGRRFSEDDQRGIESLLGLAAPALRNALRFRQVSRQLESDPLTGLGNRRAFHLQGVRWLGDCLRQGRPFSMLALDLDGLKQVNDRFGHGAGDLLIKTVATALKRATRASDLCARMGGDEFVVLLPGADLAYAMQCGERIRRVIAGVSIALADGTRIAASASVGVAIQRPGQDLEQVHHDADMALYAAKRAGSNQVLASMGGGDVSPRHPGGREPPAPDRPDGISG